MAIAHEATLKKFISENKALKDIKAIVVPGGNNKPAHIGAPASSSSRAVRNEFLQKLSKKVGGKITTHAISGAGVIEISSPTGLIFIAAITPSQSTGASVTTKGGVDPTKFKPKDINGACGVWNTPDELYEKTLNTIKTCIKGPSRLYFIKALNGLCGYGDHSRKLSTNGKATEILYTIDEFKLDKNQKIPSEVFEIFSSIALAKLLLDKNTNIMNLFGLKKESYESKNIRIFIPLAANFGLVDFFISLTDTTDIPTIQDKKGCLRVSVKALVGSTSTNVVSFKDTFQTAVQGTRVFDTYAANKYAKGKKETIFAKGAVYNTTGTDFTMYPIASAALFSKNTTAMNLLVSKASKKMAAKNGNMGTLLRETCNVLQAKMAPGGKLSGTISTAKTLANFGKTKNANPFSLTEKEEKTLQDFIDASYLNAYKQDQKVATTNRKASGNYTCPQLSWCLERIFSDASVKESNNMNFYKLFYQNVILKQGVGFAVTSTVKTSTSIQVKVNFYATPNFKNFTDWVFLRSKNAGVSTDSLVKQALGMDFVH